MKRTSDDVRLRCAAVFVLRCPGNGLFSMLFVHGFGFSFFYGA
jgi:hypothetical protein